MRNRAGAKGFLTVLTILTWQTQLGAAESKAWQTFRHLQRGANLGNYLEAPPDSGWSIPYSRADLEQIKKEGFDHIRIPIGWQNYQGPNSVLRPEIFSKVDDLVTNALALDLSVIINFHHFDAFTSHPDQELDHFVALWKQVARHYASTSDRVVFEVLNEPKDAATTDVMNGVFPKILVAIRETNPNRTVMIGPGRWNGIRELEKLKVPAEDKNIIVTVHCYEPFYFTHQGATWAGPDPKTTGIRFPGPPAQPVVPAEKLRPQVRDWIERYNSAPTESNPSSPAAFRSLLAQAVAWSRKHDCPVHVGEFGCYTKADPESRANYYRAFRLSAEENKLGWAIWDWAAGFRYWNRKEQQPEPGMRAALFGP